eukprot:TRINITY_DN2183_c0_g1_i2.p1 TRINITY_DN2183_c0_g1~~TRINITY_DN2183_c0_g1_i2.p1  ORF type:complete len:242 (-),score=24.25 TRINITY_DN2183_c0_g1_i2:10-735(-)
MCIRDRYKVDHSYTQLLQFGMGQGCKFFDTPCIDKQGRAQFEGFCNVKQQDLCTYDRRGRGTCMMVESKTAVPQHFDHLGDKFSTFFDPYTDNCPYSIPYSNGLCSEVKNTASSKHFGFDQELGPRSRCFDGDYMKKWSGKPTRHSACHTFQCAKNEAGQLVVVINIGSNKVVCPAEGGKAPIPGYSGTIICPKGAVFCTIEQVNECADFNFCSAIGKCWGGRCICPNGSNPRDCSLTASE